MVVICMCVCGVYVHVHITQSRAELCANDISMECLLHEGFPLV